MLIQREVRPFQGRTKGDVTDHGLRFASPVAIIIEALRAFGVIDGLCFKKLFFMLLISVGCSAVPFLTGCAGVAQSGDRAGVDDLEGKWVGQWFCEKTGHSGYLSCHLEQIEANQYRAHYFATYARILPYWYSVDMPLEREGERYLMKWQVDLGWLGGGWYEYEGYIEGDRFFCDYSSQDYEGTFELVREK